MDHGWPHTTVMDMPLGRLGDEARMVADRSNARMATEAILLQAAAGSIMSKEMGEAFQGLIQDLTGE